MRTTRSTGVTKILPSPILPVRAALTMASTQRSTASSATTTSIITLGRKSTTYSAPRYSSVWPFWRPKPLTSVTVRPVTPTSPSAELRPGQTDQDSLPPYEVLDAIIARYVEENASIAELLAEGFAPADVDRVTRLIKASEYKRQQSAVGTRVTRRAFGNDWRYPMTNRYRV